MQSSVQQMLPAGVRRSLTKFGADLGIARRKRHLTAAMMAERIGVAQSTYTRMEKGDPAVAMGAYAMAMFVLGLGEMMGDLIDVRRDDAGLLMDEARLPQRVRTKKNPTRNETDDPRIRRR
jgi:transcriptional regulator with XRE-family HTH domain